MNYKFIFPTCLVILVSCFSKADGMDLISKIKSMWTDKNSNKVPYQKLYSELNKIGFSIYGTFDGTIPGYKSDGKEDESLPVGFLSYMLSPGTIGNREKLADSDLMIKTAGKTISSITVMTFPFLKASGLKCDKEGLAKFLDIKPSEINIIEGSLRGEGQILAGHQIDAEQGIKIGANCHVKIANDESISFFDVISNTEVDVPGFKIHHDDYDVPQHVCWQSDRCKIPWGPMETAANMFLQLTGDSIGYDKSKASEAVRSHLKDSYIAGYNSSLDKLKETIKANNTEPARSNLVKMVNAYQEISKSSDFTTKILSREPFK